MLLGTPVFVQISQQHTTTPATAAPTAIYPLFLEIEKG
jgi:hypothetical protein